MGLYAFDGTWNRRDRQDELFLQRTLIPDQYGARPDHRRDTIETNVHRFMELFDPERARTFYQEGVGTRLRWLGGSIFGGLFGAGAKRRIRKAYRALMTAYHVKGDTHIDVIGFSRGAAMAVHFANVIKHYGVRDPRGRRELGIRYHWGLGFTWRFPRTGAIWTDGTPIRPKRGDTPDLCSGPRICFLGLWDTVGSFGWPTWPFRNRMPGMAIDSIPDIVGLTCHAMALDEVRRTFELVTLKVDRPGVPDNEKQYFLYEVWFRGVHSNVGGGYADRGLSDITLEWMTTMASFHWDRQGHPQTLRGIEPSVGQRRSESFESNPNGELGRPKDLRRSGWRPTAHRRFVHHSAYLRDPHKISDFGRSHEALVRRIPADRIRVADPPLFEESGTLAGLVEGAAEAIYYRIPVEPRPWLVSGRVRRHDDRLEIDKGTPAAWRITKAEFMPIARDWIMGGMPECPGLGAGTPFTLRRLTVEILAALQREGLVPWQSDLAMYRLSRSIEQLIVSLGPSTNKPT
jgi:hypothetical protein